jgi:hypothetical protein
MTIAAQPPADRAARERHGCRGDRPGVGGVEHGRQFVEQVGLVAQQVGLAGEHGDEIAACRVTRSHQRLTIEPREP